MDKNTKEEKRKVNYLTRSLSEFFSPTLCKGEKNSPHHRTLARRQLGSVALFMAFLIIMLPIVDAQAIGDQPTAQGEETTVKPLFVNATIPRYPRTMKIDIAGITKPGATITININGADVKKDIIDDGTFLFKQVQLQASNAIIITAELGGETATQTYQADVDNSPPLINITTTPVVTAASSTVKVKVSEPVNLTVQAGNQTNKSYSLQAGSNDVKIELQPGENMVGFTAVDRAGFKSFIEERIVYDTGPPRFEKTNLNQLSPTYRQEVEVKGKLSEPGSVTAFVNGKPQKTEATASDGSFSIKVKLERSLSVTAGSQSASGVTGGAVSIEQGIQWKSKLRLEAIDAAGLKATTEEVEIAYSICGSGTWIDVQLTDPMPDILNPRLIIEGIQQVGIGFNYTYRGGAKAEIDARSIRIRTLMLSPEVRKEFDNNLVMVRAPNVRAQRATKPSGVGYIQVNFNPLEDPWSLPEKDGKKEEAPANATMFDREQRISQHREGDCITPGFGCMKLFLELEIPFTETTRKMAYDPIVRGTLEKDVVEPLTQRTCIDVNIAIDKRVPPDVLPSGLLRASSEFLGAVIQGIDKVLMPIQTIGKYLFYTCVAGQFLSLVPIVLEKYNCEFRKVADVLAGGEGAFDPNVAAINACDAEYGAGSDAADNCNTCHKWKDYRKKFVRTYRQICDRVMCPAAPSLQYYLKTRGRESPTEVKAENAKADPVIAQYAQGGKLFAGSDCAAWVDVNKRKEERGTKKPVLAPRLFFTTDEIQKIYDNWLKHQSNTAGETETGGVNCAGLHPATPECCGYEYMQEWSSACGTSALGQSLDTFDEIKESTCLAAQRSGKNEIGGLEGESIQCNKLLNAASGFCEKNGMPPLTPIRVTTIDARKAESLELQKYAESNDLYIIVQDKGAASSILGVVPTGQSQGYSIKLGLIIKTLEFQKSDKPEIIATSERSKLTEKLDVIEYPEYTAFQTSFFSQEQIDVYREKAAIPPDFKKTLCDAAGKKFGQCNIDEKYIYAQVIQAIGSPDKDYIIKPNEGLINSVRCLCIPTIVGYLKLWRGIMGAVKSCIDTILLTGDGENGMCQALVSRYVCDLLYDALACFTQKFGTGQGRVEKEGGGDIMGALVSAGSEMQREVQGRYGETGLYKAVFVDRKLVHSICMWAFTGTWNFDLGAIFDQAIDEIPISSQALLTPCNRRFVSFNPTTRPGGLVTWVYHFGSFFAAGADAEIELHLVCSDDFTCKESDGFENGKCDCQGKGKRDIVIRPENLPTRAKKNQILSEEIFFTMQAGSGESNVRYDKAYLLYRWKEANKQMKEDKTEPCSIGLTGGGGSMPAFCRWDPFTVSFRCQFGEAAGGIRFKSGKPDYKHPTVKGGVFALDESVSVELQMQQDYPGGEKYNKYLQYTILGPGNKELATNKDRGLILLQTNGDYNKRLSADGTPPVPIEIKREWFTTVEAGKTFSARQWAKSPQNPTGTAADNKVIEDVQLVGLVGAVAAQKQFVLELTRQGDKINYAVYTAGTNDKPGVGEKGGFYVATPALCTGTISGTKITCTPSIAPRPGQPPQPQDTLTITLKADPLYPTVDELIQLHINMNIPRTLAADPCKGDVNNRYQQSFKMMLMAYDADNYGSPSEQVAVDPYTGAEAVFEIPFYAMCATADELKPLEGILGPAEILAGLSKDINAWLAPEKDYKTKLEGFVSQPLKIEQTTSVQNQLDQIIFGETANSVVLEKYKTNLKNITGMDAVKAAVEELYNIIRPPFHAELDLRNVVGLSIDAKNVITNELKGTPNVTKIQDALRPIIPELQKALEAKQKLLTLLPAAAGEKGACPSGKQVPEKTGEYYLCATSLPSDKWVEVTDRQCYAVEKQTCYKLSASNLCYDKNTNGDTFHCDTECKGNSETSSEQRICPKKEEPTCCVVKSTIAQKLLQLKNQIGQQQGDDESFRSSITTTRTNEELITYLVGTGDINVPTLISELKAYASLKNLEREGLSSVVGSSGLTPTDEVRRFIGMDEDYAWKTTFMVFGIPFELHALSVSVENLNKMKDDLVAMAQAPPTAPNGPSPENIKAAIARISLEVGVIKATRALAINSLDKDLGIIPKTTEEVVKETAGAAPAAASVAAPPKLPLSINGKTDLAIITKGTDIQVKIILPKNVQAFEYIELFAYKSNVHIATWDLRNNYNPSTGEATYMLGPDQYANFVIGETYEFDMAYNPPHTIGNKVQVRIIVPPCGDGKIDQGEVCDRKSDGTVIASNEMVYNPTTFTAYWQIYAPSMGPFGATEYRVLFSKNMQTFCNDIIGEDCDDKVEYSAEKGWCSGDCKKFMPRVGCVDDDTIGDSGRAAYLTPEFYYEGTEKKMNNVWWYLFSDPNAGRNGCYPTTEEAGLPPYNDKWTEAPVPIDYPQFMTKPAPFQPPTAQP